MITATNQKVWWWLLFFIIVVSVFFIWQINAFGLEYDEALYANASLGCRQLEIFNTWFIRVGPYDCLPLMVSSYLGGWPAWLYRLVAVFLPTTVWSYRLVGAAWYVLLLGLTFALSLRWRDRKLAILTTLLMAADVPLWLDLRFKSILGPTLVLRLLGLWLMSQKQLTWKTTVLAGLAGGLSLWAKLDSGFVLLAMIVSAIMIWIGSPALRHQIRLVRILPQFSIGLMAGMLPLLIFLLRFHQPVLSSWLAVAQSQSITWGTKLTNLGSIINGAGQTEAILGQVVTPLVTVSAAAFWSVFGVTIWRWRRLSHLHRWLWLTCVIFILEFFLVGSLAKSHHWLMMAPLPHLVVAMTVINLKLSRMQLLGLIGLLMLGMVVWSGQWIGYLQQESGVRGYDPRSTQLAQMLPVDQPIIVADWGITNQLIWLHHSQAPVIEIPFLHSTTLATIKNTHAAYWQQCITIVGHQAQQASFLAVQTAYMAKAVNYQPRYQLRNLNEYYWQLQCN
jgi:hypothetical protein